MSILLFNFSVIGPKATGLGSFAMACAECIAKNFPSFLLSSRSIDLPFKKTIYSPPEIIIGSGLTGLIKRLLFFLFGRPKNFSWVFNPTHHGFFGFREQIITIHDIIPLKYRSQNKLQYIYFRFLLYYLIKYSKAVFTVSNYTKDNLKRFFKIDGEKIHVIPNPIDLKIFKPSEIKSDRKYLLLVGGSLPHKNLEEVLYYNYYWKDKFFLKITGCSPSYRKKLESLAKKLGILNKIKFLNFLSKESLVTLYQNSAALIYPSLEEGFGIPPLEAMACGIPVLVSNIPVHKEILENAPIYITLGDRISWENGFKLLENKIFIEKKIQKGFQQAEKFSFEHFCEKLTEAITSVFPEIKTFGDIP